MNKFKKVLKKLSVLTTVAVMYVYAINSVVAANDSAIYKIDSFTGYLQEEDAWCWVACAETSGKHLVSSSRNQSSAVTFVKGSRVNEGGTIREIAKAANYFTLDRYNYVGYNHAYSAAFLKGQIMSDRIPILGMSYYESGYRTGGHATVAYMVTYNTDGTNGIGYYDTEDNRKYICSFEEFCDGSYNGWIYEETCYTNI